MLKWTISHLPDENIIHIVTSGQATVEELDKMAKQAKETSEQTGSTLFLIDHRKTTVKLQTIDIYDRPEYLDTIEFPRQSQIAQVCHESELKNFQFFEVVSQNRGYMVRVFMDINKARQWLLAQ